MKHSRIVQRRCNTPNDAVIAFAKEGTAGEIPVVLVPTWNTMFYAFMNIPSGVFVLWQRWQANKGLHVPGFIPFWPAWNRVSHVVTKAANTYNAPVRNCPTSDNVMVGVDVSVTFQISDAEKFVYDLGAAQCDELMSAQTDEAIRGLVRGVPAMRVLDLREEFASGMLRGLNAKINQFGVVILNVKVTNVMLPPKLAKTLENTTSFQTQMQQQEKAHQAMMRVLYDEAERKLTGIRRQNERTVQDVKATIAREHITREERVLATQAQREVAVLDAQANLAVEKTAVLSEKENAKAMGEILAVERVERHRALAEAERVKADQLLVTTKLKAQATIEEAESQAKAITVIAEAEGKAAKLLQEERDFVVEQERQAAKFKLAGNGKFLVAGATGETLLKDLTDLNGMSSAMVQ